MLLKAETYEALDFHALMEVYAEGVVENGEYFYPNEPKERQILLLEQDFKNYLIQDFFKATSASYWIWTECGSYISALRLEAYRDGFLLEALETKPQLRRKGYAKKLILAVLSELTEGTKIYSIVSKANTASFAVHDVCGFIKISDHAIDSGDGAILEDHVTLCFTK